MMGTQLPETCRKVEINILRNSVQLVGFICKRLYRDAGQQNIKTNAKLINSLLSRSLLYRSYMFQLQHVTSGSYHSVPAKLHKRVNAV